MGASVTGLYAALAGESTYRLLPVTYFWWSALGLASAVLLAGACLLHQYYPATQAGPQLAPRQAQAVPEAKYPLQILDLQWVLLAAERMGFEPTMTF